MKNILSATKSQMPATCLASSLVAICYPFDPEVWTRQDLDVMLDVGFQKYQQAVRNSKGKVKTGDHLGYWEADFLEPTVTVEKRSVRFEVNDGNAIEDFMQGLQMLHDIFH